MGVHGLWKLIDSAGKPVPVETLESKVLAVDVSIWLHQLMKGYQTPSGSSVSNAYLLGLFSRVCKLLFTNVKPVFVFDGGVPQLKRKTIAARQQQKNKSAQASEKLREQLLKNLLKQKAVSQVLEEIRGQSSPKKKAPDMYELPPLPADEESPSDVEEELNSSSEEDVKPIKLKFRDLHTIDVNSEDFKTLPADMRHDILTELKETRKQNSWGKIHEMPEESNDFSKYQMNRLLKRRSVQVSLEEAEKEMGGRTLSLGDVEALLAEGGIEINPQLSKRIASDEVTRYLYVRETGEHTDSSQNSLQSLNAKSDRVPSSQLFPSAKIKEEIIETYELSDDELLKEVEAIEMVHKEIKVEKIDEEEAKEVEAIEMVPKEIKTENLEFGTEEMFDSGSSSEGVIIDGMDLVKDNSGLSQEQILAIIKQQNEDKEKSFDPFGESVPSTSKDGFSLQENNTKESLSSEFESAKFTSLDPMKVNVKDLSEKESADSDSKILEALYSKMNEKIQTILARKAKIKKALEASKVLNNSNNSSLHPSNSNNSSLNNVAVEERAKPSLKPINLPAVASNSSDSENDPSKDLPCQVSMVVLPNSTNTSNRNKSPGISKFNSNIETTNGLDMSSSSESDSEFIDVSPAKDEAQSPFVSNKTFDGLEIKIQQTQDKIEDDIFADIFLEKKKNSNGLLNEEINIDDEVLAETNHHVTDEELKEDDNKDSEVANNTLESIQFPNEKHETLNNDSKKVDTPSEDKEDITNAFNVNDAKIKKEITSPVHNQHESEDSEDVDNPSVKQDASSSVSNTSGEKIKKKLNTHQLEKLQDILETKERELLIDHNREDRLATSITDQMYQEAQELLRLFGVPYVVAPMEAEAQCAFLDAAGLTQGTITDDSDIWLFGARKVYKNFFDQKKFVLEYQANDIQSFFKLSRGHLVLLALLVGSDYTVGLQGVGPVTALEILSTFPPPQPDSRDSQELLASLISFKQWWQSQSTTNSSLAKKLKNIDLHQGFPSPAVVSAYLQPVVDDSMEPFSWGDPDLSALRDYAERKFGWSRNRTDQMLLPVVNKLSQKTSQLTLHTFFGAIPNISAQREQMSRRVQLAVNRLDGGSDNFEPASPRPRQPRSRGRGRAAQSREPGTSARGRGRGRGRNPLDNDEQLFIHESVGKAPEVIPQREKDKLEALKRKQQAIDILKNRKKKRMKRKNVRQEKPEANLSESSSDD